MGKRLTLTEIKNRLKDISPNIEIIDGDYKNANSTLKCRCLTDGHIWNSKWNNLRRKRGCPKCSCHIKLTYNEVHAFFSDNNLELLCLKYKNSKTNMKARIVGTEYLVFTSVAKLRISKNPSIFGNGNPYTNKNVKVWMSKNKPNIEICDEVKTTSQRIELKCLIDNYVWSSTFNELKSGKGCPKCAKNAKYTQQEVVNILKQYGLTMLSEYINASTCIQAKDFDGYMYNVRIHNLIKGRKPSAFQAQNPFTIYNIKLWLSKINSDIELISDEYNGNERLLKLVCKKDGCEFKRSWNNLLDRATCPVCNESSGESRIRNFLEYHNIKYNRQQKFCNLIGVGKRHLSYDFYLNDYDILIEYQGIQHTEPVEFFGGEQRFKIQHDNDKIKKEYAKNNGYDLLEIWHSEHKNIEQILKNKLL